MSPLTPDSAIKFPTIPAAWLGVKDPPSSDKKKLYAFSLLVFPTRLPSFTEGQPHVVDESLARGRPVLIFKDISHIIKDRKGIFVCERNIESFSEKTNFIKNNYIEIQNDIKKNKFPLEKDMFKQIANIINNS
mgnify:CR=1 FL=1